MSFGPQFAPPPGVVQPAGQYYQPVAPYVPVPPSPPAYPGQFRPQPWAPPAPMAPMPIPVMRAPVPAAPPAMQQMPQTPVPWAPIHFQIPAGLVPSSLGYYGYYPDQMWGALAAVPPVWRPQQPNESFGSRALKNLILVIMEKTFEQGMLMTRQMFFPPALPKAAMSVVDVTPQH